MKEVAKFFIEGRFTSLNEYIALERGHLQQGATSKRRDTALSALFIPLDSPILNYPVSITFKWFRKNRRTDPDNLTFGQKAILDAMQIRGMLRKDGWKEIRELHHLFELSDVEGVMVTVEEPD